MVSKYKLKNQQRHAPKKASSPKRCPTCGYKIRGKVRDHETSSHHMMKHPGKRDE